MKMPNLALRNQDGIGRESRDCQEGEYIIIMSCKLNSEVLNFIYSTSIFVRKHRRF